MSGARTFTRRTRTRKKPPACWLPIGWLGANSALEKDLSAADQRGQWSKPATQLANARSREPIFNCHSHSLPIYELRRRLTTQATTSPVKLARRRRRRVLFARFSAI